MRGRRVQQDRDPFIGAGLVLCCNAEPDMPPMPIQIAILREHELTHPLGSFRQHEVGVAGLRDHDRPDPADGVVRHLLMKEIPHGHDEDPPRLPPPFGQHGFIHVPRVGLEPVLVSTLARGLEPLRHHGRVAVRAPLGDRRASRYRVPSFVRPAYARGHLITSNSRTHTNSVQSDFG